jgi:copper(I)-binding protein
MRCRGIAALGLIGAIGCHGGGGTGAAAAGPLRISEAFAFQPVTQDEAAVYFEIRNTGDQPDTLVSASTPIAAGAMIHGIGAAGMTATAGLEIPAQGVVRLQPGQLHLMLTSLKRIPRSGEDLPLTLHFRRAGEVTLEVPVRPYGR